MQHSHLAQPTRRTNEQTAGGLKSATLNPGSTDTENRTEDEEHDTAMILRLKDARKQRQWFQDKNMNNALTSGSTDMEKRQTS